MDAILNWLWQGCLVALAAAAALRAPALSQARARYCVWWLAFVVVLLLPGVPLFWSATVPAAVIGADAPAPVVPSISISTGWRMSTPVIIVGWASWSCVSVARLAAAMLALRRAKAQCRHLPLDVETRLACWTRVKGQGRRASLVVSDRVGSAAVLGYHAPAVAVAPALLELLGDDELDRVVIHEWAHVQRRDDLTNLVQLLARAAAGWHPAVWWIDRQLHAEREAACDEMAVAVTGSAKRYAACLTKLAGLPQLPTRSVPAPCAVSSSRLRGRVVRILALSRTARRGWTKSAAMSAGVGVCAVALAAGGLRLFDTIAPPPGTDTRFQTAPIEGGAVGRPENDPRMVSSRSSRDRLDPRASVARRPARHRDLPQREAVIELLPSTAFAASAALELPFLVDARSVQTSHSADPVRPESRQPMPDATAPNGLVFNDTAATDTARVSPLAATADAGAAVGRHSQRAAVATAGFFSRFGKRIAGAF